MNLFLQSASHCMHAVDYFADKILPKIALYLTVL